MSRTYQTSNSANYQTNYSNTYSPGTVYIQRTQPAATYVATPTQQWGAASPTRVYYDSVTRSPRANTWGAPNQQMSYYDSRNSIERYSADDPGLMTQYYGTQKTSYARYPHRHVRQEEVIQQQSVYQSSSTSGWNNPSPRQAMPTNRVTYRPPAQQNYISCKF